MKQKELIFQLDNGKKFDAILNYPKNTGDYSAVITHGANNDMHNSLLKKTAEVLVEHGVPVLRFNFPYKYENRKSPDTNKILRSTWIKSYNYMRNHPDFPSKKMITIGKSMGGRIAAEVVSAKLIEPDIMAFLGYPLHAPGKSDNSKDSVFYSIDSPLIFISGTKDPLCSKEVLGRVDEKLGDNSFVYFVEGGSHSLALKGMDEGEIDLHYGFIASELKEMIFKMI